MKLYYTDIHGEKWIGQQKKKLNIISQWLQLALKKNRTPHEENKLFNLCYMARIILGIE